MYHKIKNQTRSEFKILNKFFQKLYSCLFVFFFGGGERIEKLFQFFHNTSCVKDTYKIGGRMGWLLVLKAKFSTFCQILSFSYLNNLCYSSGFKSV